MIASVTMAIVADLRFEVRGQVIRLVQTSFATSQSQRGFPWLSGFQAAGDGMLLFQFIAGLSLLALAAVAYALKPLNTHLTRASDRDIFSFLKRFSNGKYLHAFVMMALLSVGGFMFMPFLSAFSVSNLGISQDSLPLVYLSSGITSIVAGIVSGRLCDSAGKFPVFFIGTIFSTITVAIYSNLATASLFVAVVVNSLLFVGISSKRVSGEP